MIHELFPDETGSVAGAQFERTAKAASCAAADCIIAISATTRDDLARILRIDASKIAVVHLASSIDAEVGDADSPREKYLLYVGPRGHYKNFDSFLRAFAATAIQKTHHVICFGGGAFSVEEGERIARSGLAGRVVHREGDDLKLAQSYQRAAALVYPSLYEGFGLPVVEAMKLGCPVICSLAGALPEVAGDAAAYFRPRELDSIRETLDDTLSNPKRLRELSALGKERARSFTWERCVSETLQVYRKLIRNGAGSN
jgi:glycosyltransferase involved in cell wall biosynthesis